MLMLPGLTIKAGSPMRRQNRGDMLVSSLCGEEVA
jgi:hypothetical protein